MQTEIWVYGCGAVFKPVGSLAVMCYCGSKHDIYSIALCCKFHYGNFTFSRFLWPFLNVCFHFLNLNLNH